MSFCLLYGHFAPLAVVPMKTYVKHLYYTKYYLLVQEAGNIVLVSEYIFLFLDHLWLPLLLPQLFPAYSSK
ncbi:MAG: hypothetical protein KHW87_06155 [Clostridiales bacterium]|nr:hypothetical protein [Clostridiales bacterium]